MLEDGTQLDNRAETDTFKLLVQVYRLHIEDECNFNSDVDDDSIYVGGNPKIGFCGFLRSAELARKFLPSWWSTVKRPLR